MKKLRVGIIGGGISGTALGYHLSLYGNAEVVLFEKNAIGCGTTSKSAGTVCLFDDSLRNRYWDVRLYGFESYLKMEREEKGSTGFDKTGTLVAVTSEEVEATVETGIALAKAAGYQGEYITDKDRIKKILPLIDVENILGAGYTQDDGYFDGTMISNTYARKMQQKGGVVYTMTPVVEIVVSGGKAAGVKTAGGTMHLFDRVVDCTGPWSRFTGKMAGLDVPIWHTKAEAFFLSPPGKKLNYVFPVLKYPAFYALRAGDNIFICKSHLSMDLDNPMHAGQWDPDKLPATGGTDDYFIEFLFEQMQKSVPGLVASGLVSSWLSYRAEPRDFLPLLGETPIDGYILATGYGGNGIIEAPAASRDLAKFIMRGESTPLLEDWAFKRLWGKERS
ncbi:MAG: FAD-binding oxidoreductase [Synergistaceae bacterium]|jgi:glycine/D-amino acid oxidase-like deaminating enzyme|nr:FAD-binding oxidoreductase [Synergistaceae bacterium]